MLYYVCLIKGATKWGIIGFFAVVDDYNFMYYNFTTFSGCGRILKADACEMRLYSQSMPQWPIQGGARAPPLGKPKTVKVPH